jgi:hypothetical protein
MIKLANLKGGQKLVEKQFASSLIIKFANFRYPRTMYSLLI